MSASFVPPTPTTSFARPVFPYGEMRINHSDSDVAGRYALNAELEWRFECG